MARIARVVIEGVPHHVTQRGNAKQRVFRTNSDYRLYLALLAAMAKQHALSIWAYCLMPNHVHLVCVPGRADSLARTLGRTHAEFARHSNIERQSCGHLWQARFYSCPLDWAHLWQAMAYVELNPVRAGLLDDAETYAWSSAKGHIAPAGKDRWIELGPWLEEYGPRRWQQVLREGINQEALAERIRLSTRSGWPLGSEEFVARMELLVGRRLRPLPPGRRRKKEPESAIVNSPGQGCLEIGV